MLLFRKIREFVSPTTQRNAQPERETRTSLKFQRSRSTEHLEALLPESTQPGKAARRWSLPILKPRETATEKEIRRTRKNMQSVAATLNVFSPDQRPLMLDLAGQLAKYKDMVPTTSVVISDDEQSFCAIRFELQAHSGGNIVVVEQTVRHRDMIDIRREPALTFSPQQLKQGKAQLETACTWLAFDAADFHNERPIFRPLVTDASSDAFSD